MHNPHHQLHKKLIELQLLALYFVALHASQQEFSTTSEQEIHSTSDTLQPEKNHHDESGIAGMRYQNIDYVFEKNILGDVIGVYRATDGALMGTYKYDAWGNILSQTNNPVVNANPFRYRGYYYDQETKLYYLNSRYYDPETGRFINPDNPLNLFYTADMPFGANLYQYAYNNPVMYYDPTGEIAWFIPLIWIGVGALAAANVASIGYSTYQFATNPTAENAGWLALEFVPIPFIGAIGKTTKTAVKTTDKIAGAGKITGKAGVIQLDSTVSYATAKSRFWKSQAAPGGKFAGDANALKGLSPVVNGQKMVLHHPYGRQGNLYQVQIKTQADHIAFHKVNGYFYRNGSWVKRLYGG